MNDLTERFGWACCVMCGLPLTKAGAEDAVPVMKQVAHRACVKAFAQGLRQLADEWEGAAWRTTS